MRQPNVFVSYTHDSPEHKKWVHSLAKQIDRQGATVWIDQDRLVPGQSLADELRRAWDQCDAAIVVFTSAIRRSEYAQMELEVLARRAAQGSIRLIPILRDGAWSELPKDYRSWVGIDMRHDEEYLENLVRLRQALFQSNESVGTAEVAAAANSGGARHISRLRLQRVKLFEDLELDFGGEDGKPRSWTCILADNGCGKTTLLQSIALAAAGDTLATKLTDDPRSFAPAFDSKAQVAIEADFVDSSGHALRARLELVQGSHDWFGAGPEDSDLRSLRNRRQGGFFVAAYGAGRRLSRAGQVAVPPDPILARVRNLFDQEYQLLGLEFGDAFHDPELRTVFLDRVNRLIDLRPPGSDALLPGVNSVGIAEEAVPGAARGDVAVTLNLGNGKFQLGPALLSSGYQSILAWLGEVVGHQLLDFGPEIDLSELGGIVLIDELDQHLHPTWQRRVVPILRAMFPRMQFVITTHSPLVLTGFAASEIVAIGIEDGRLVQREGPLLEPAMQTGSQLYSTFFGTPTAGRPGLVEKEREALSLYAQTRLLTDREKERLSTLEAELGPFWQFPLQGRATNAEVPDTAKLKAILADLGQP
jgi:TIR domain/AAA domain, putative AbiEii toxin, Type IV TA system